MAEGFADVIRNHYIPPAVPGGAVGASEATATVRVDVGAIEKDNAWAKVVAFRDPVERFVLYVHLQRRAHDTLASMLLGFD